MNAPFLGGLFAAWAVGIVACGVFFVMAFAVRRHEAEYLLFGFVCFALALQTLGVSMGYSATNPADWPRAALVAHLGAILGAAANLHFVLHYTGSKWKERVVLPLYALAAVFVAAMVLDAWWVPGSSMVGRTHLFGWTFEHVAARPRWIGVSFYVVAAAELAVSVVLFGRSYLAGKREAGVAFVAGLAVAAAVVNDAMLVSGVAGTVYLTPNAFLVYAFAVGATLLFRYGSTAGELESVALDLRERTDELRSSYATLRAVQEELAKKRQLAAVGELAAMIAHEVRNPIAVIVNAVASLRRRGIVEENRGMLLGIVEEETARLNRLVTNLLQFARPVNVRRVELALPELVCRSIGNVESDDRSVKYQLDVAVDPSPPSVYADAGLLRLVLDNLLSNARQSMPAGGVVRVRIEGGRSDDVEGVLVCIEDQGEGMEEDVLTRAVDPFFTTRPSGTGLGLPIVERILQAHGGSLNIDSESGRGTTVSLFVPVGEADSVPEPAVEAARTLGRKTA